MNSRNFTPSDITPDNIQGFLITTTAGDVAIDYDGGNSAVLTAVPTGVWIPTGNAIRIKATGTTAVGFLVV